MAIDTNEKKLSLLDSDVVWEGLPLPDGSLDQGDKQHLLGSYSGILFQTPTIIGGWSINDIMLIKRKR